MIEKYKFNQEIFNLGPSSDIINTQDNIFTVIVGKNGTGKSRLLRGIIGEFIGLSPDESKTHVFSHYRKMREGELGENICFKYIPKKIIAASTSPFDKFPIPRRGSQNDIEYYKYMGLRNLTGNNLGLSYMASIFNSLISSILSREEFTAKLTSILTHLDYEQEITGSYTLGIASTQYTRIRNVLDDAQPFELFVDIFLFGSKKSGCKLNKDFFIYSDDDSLPPKLESVSKIKVEQFLNLYERIFNFRPREKIEITIGKGGVSGTFKNGISLDDFNFCLDSGLLNLDEITLIKYDNPRVVKFQEASSGEQSVVMSILGIASQLEDNSLVCIDEPEVCLHPEWQEKYIELLINTFRDFNGCHFLIASHSPLIVAKLEDNNCFVMSMDDGLLVDASTVNRRSVDFQLANVFKCPGFKNEFLTRTLISAIGTFSEEGKFSEDQIILLKGILELKDSISNSDPVMQLMKMAEEALEGDFA